ncbi:hypothetical protein, partial [Leptospira kirschneri]|uniref:hypothetical protein n=1 Tax=Leptospira kirschneri TaxID=29507 RepID=UPI0006ACEC80
SKNYKLNEHLKLRNYSKWMGDFTKNAKFSKIELGWELFAFCGRILHSQFFKQTRIRGSAKGIDARKLKQNALSN